MFVVVDDAWILNKETKFNEAEKTSKTQKKNGKKNRKRQYS